VIETSLPLLMITGFFMFFGTVIWGAVTRTWSRESWTMSLSDFMIHLKRGDKDLRYMQMLLLGVGSLLLFYPLLISFVFLKFTLGFWLPLGVLVFITARITIAYWKA
jgi:hypothetical protein